MVPGRKSNLRSPHAQIKIAAFLAFCAANPRVPSLQQIQLRPVSEETGFVHRQILEQFREFGAAFAAG